MKVNLILYKRGDGEIDMYFFRLIIYAKRQRMWCQKCKASRVSRYRLAVMYECILDEVQCAFGIAFMAIKK